MPGSHFSPGGGTLGDIERPRCPHCRTRMVLQGIAPAPPGYDLRTFACDTCDRVATELVPSDPMKNGQVVRWLDGDLKRPV